MVKQQRQWLQHKTAPSAYIPKLIAIDHPTQHTLHKLFLNDFNNILMKHMKKAIEANTTTLEIKKVRLQAVLNQTTSRTSDQPSAITRAANLWKSQ